MINNYDVAVLSEKVAYLENALKTAGVLPEVSASDNGATLQVVEGVWAKGIDLPELPNVVPTDAGKVLSVDDSGSWEAATLDADNVEYSTGVSVKDELDRMNANSVTVNREVQLDVESVNVTATSDCYVSIVSRDSNSLVYLTFANLAVITALAGSSTEWVRNAIYVRKGMTFTITGAYPPGQSGTFAGSYFIYPIS